jgi:hypothetical protein
MGASALQSRLATGPALAILLVKTQREIPSMARKRKSRTWDVTAQGPLLDDLYEGIRRMARIRPRELSLPHNALLAS